MGVNGAAGRDTPLASGVMRIVMRAVCQTAGVALGPQASVDGTVVLGVRADPEPVDRVPFEQTQGPPAADPDGIDGLFRVDSLELKAGVRRILLPEAIVLPGSFPDLGR